MSAITSVLLATYALITPHAPVQDCAADLAAPALDHVILVVRDLDDAAAGFSTHGFRLKQGRLHPNNLLNRHIKFRDGTSIELMTVRGEPRDAMSRDYARLIGEGEGGVYVALNGAADGAARAAAQLGLETVRSTSGPWRFVSFPARSPAAAVFFVSGGTPVSDPDSLVTHAADISGLTEVWLEGGSELGDLLVRLGAQRCGLVRSHDGRLGERIALSRGSVVVTRGRAASRPRVLGAVLAVRAADERIVWPHPSFWVEYRPER